MESQQNVTQRRQEQPQRMYVEGMGQGDRGEKRTGKKITWDPRVPGAGEEAR